MLLDLGINSDGIQFEVALDLLGEARQPFMQAIHEERPKPAPSSAFIGYCERRLAALDELQDDWQPADLATIERILTKGEVTFKIQ